MLCRRSVGSHHEEPSDPTRFRLSCEGRYSVLNRQRCNLPALRLPNFGALSIMLKGWLRMKAVRKRPQLRQASILGLASAQALLAWQRCKARKPRKGAEALARKRSLDGSALNRIAISKVR
ncbi:unnamed protein product [Effrenium voratum]|uniref:Uncharacterized protein n=1 Tax=Effrenium voratum TaxID=2562239 RepID=A0AA36MW05_9DINO|nr:unnamed protein product [Effrenium voratum]CAJ1446086.1 unnamed protein product [Effrenium voratum]